MAYSAPRTWDGTETSHAAYLEVMRENNKALHDRLPKVNLGFYGALIVGDNNYKVWVMQHRLRYMHYHLQTQTATTTAAKLFVTQDLSSMGSNLFGSNHAALFDKNDYTISSAGGDSGAAVDLNALTVGDWYFVVVEVEGTNSGLYVLNLYESSES